MYEILEKKVESVCDILSLLSNEKRLLMLCYIADGQRSIWELTSHLGISQSLCSQFAIKMRECGILKSEKKGKEVYYSVADSKTLELIQSLKTIYCSGK